MAVTLALWRREGLDFLGESSFYVLLEADQLIDRGIIWKSRPQFDLIRREETPGHEDFCVSFLHSNNVARSPGLSAARK